MLRKAYQDGKRIQTLVQNRSDLQDLGDALGESEKPKSYFIKKNMLLSRQIDRIEEKYELTDEEWEYYHNHGGKER
jgi:hypothetical protein